MENPKLCDMVWRDFQHTVPSWRAGAEVCWAEKWHRNIFLPFASMKARMNQLEVGDRRELKGIQIGSVLGAPF